MDSDPVQTCLDLAYDLSAMGRNDDIVRLLSGLEQSRPDCRNKPLYYALGYFSGLCGGTSEEYYEKAAAAPLGRCYPSRFGEIAVLEDVRKKTGSDEAAMLLGCLYYNKLHYEKAAALWASCKEAYPAKRNLAVACFSHLGQSEKALPLMKELLAARPDDEQLLYETVVLMDKTGAAPEEKIALLLSHAPKRDDLITELAKAYNQSLRPDDALKTLLSHVFVPCEGGEHAIADQYLFAHLAKAKAAYAAGQYREAAALCREGQTLPESLGAGIWNRCKLVPLRYHEAISLEKCGEKEKADEIFRDIVGIEIEFFSKMHLVELPYFQAKACLHLGEAVMARQIMTKAAREWARIGDGESDGFFSTTPFFLSFVDDPKRLRAAQYLYLTALCDGFKGDGAAAEKLRGSIRRNNENLLALLYEKTGFPD